jgi:NADH pyrophosphatase NudC (nudix superfamily)
MNVKEHNELIKIVFDGNKHLQHVMTSEQIKKMTMYEGRYPLTRMPVCGHCERLAYWYNENAYCPECGTVTKKPITYSSYLASGYDVDTGIAKQMLDKEKREAYLPDYGE